MSEEGHPVPVEVGAPGTVNNGDVANPSVPQSASLYVGELDYSVTEAMLFELFNMIAPVASIRVCRDAVTRRSLGYAYVNYNNVQDCERAIEAFNYAEIKGKPCRIMWSQRDPALRKSGNGNIFIKNLDASIDNKALHDTFVAFGNILSCKVATEDGVSKGYGFVHFEKDESARAAIEQVNGMLLNDKKVFVGRHIPRRERQSKFEEMRARFTNLYVKNLPADVDDDKLRELFEPFGSITSAVVAVDNEGKSRGFGFVNFERHDEAVKAVEGMHDQQVGENKLFVSRAQKKHEREEELRRQYEQAKLEKLSKYQGVNLYIKNLEDDIDDDKLRQEFSVYGDITSAKVMRDETGKPKGFGFVCFNTPDEATKAVTEMNGRMLGAKPIYVALAQRKEIRRRELEAQAAHRTQLRLQATMGIPTGPGGVPGPMYSTPPPMYYNNPPQVPVGGYPPRGAGGLPAGYQPTAGGAPRGNRWNTNPNASAGAQPGGYQPGYPGSAGANGVNYGASPMMHGRPARGGRPGGAPRGGAAGRGHLGNAARQTIPQSGRPVTGVKSQGGRATGASATTPSTNQGSPAAGEAVGKSAETTTATGTSAATETVATDEAGPSLTLASLADASPEDQKSMIGEALYPLIEEQEPELAGKITGMLLEMDNSELLHLLEDNKARDAKVEEALSVLQQHEVIPSN